MMDCKNFFEIANNIINRYGTSNPFELCSHMGINVRYMDLGNVKGMYKYIKRNYFVVISNKISKREQYEICCHELCHHILHRNVCENSFIWDGMLFGKDTVVEHEANMLCAEIMIDDEELQQLAKDGNSLGEISSVLEVRAEFVKLKAFSMKCRGYDLDGDFAVSPDFLVEKL